jgi:hypothetical protein
METLGAYALKLNTPVVNTAEKLLINDRAGSLLSQTLIQV